MYCPQCGLRQPANHRFCMSCGTRFPSVSPPVHRPEATRLFRSIPVHPDDHAEGILRVSRYLDEFLIETPEGFGNRSQPPRSVLDLGGRPLPLCHVHSR